jgi:hypothetical protein
MFKKDRNKKPQCSWEKIWARFYMLLADDENVKA